MRMLRILNNIINFGRHKEKKILLTFDMNNR
jgi:hypothetical protein